MQLEELKCFWNKVKVGTTPIKRKPYKREYIHHLPQLTPMVQEPRGPQFTLYTPFNANITYILENALNIEFIHTCKETFNTS